MRPENMATSTPIDVTATGHARCADDGVWYGACAVAQLEHFKTRLAWSRAMYLEHGPNLAYLDDGGVQGDFWGTQIGNRLLF